MMNVHFSIFKFHEKNIVYTKYLFNLKMYRDSKLAGFVTTGANGVYGPEVASAKPEPIKKLA
jgi:hypothetical protein